MDIVLSANCNCSGEMDIVTDDDVTGIGNDELADVMHSTVNMSQLDTAAVKVELPDELLNT